MKAEIIRTEATKETTVITTAETTAITTAEITVTMIVAEIATAIGIAIVNVSVIERVDDQDLEAVKGEIKSDQILHLVLLMKIGANSNKLKK